MLQSKPETDHEQTKATDIYGPLSRYLTQVVEFRLSFSSDFHSGFQK